MQSILITGTDTNAGKTIATAAIYAYYTAVYPERKIGILKPLQSGVGDREYYQNIFNLTEDLTTINPVYFSAPLAPPIAAKKENKNVDLATPWQVYKQLLKEKDLVLIEGVGGLGSPITDELVVADLARDWRLPTILVVPIKLGSIAQIVANVALARQYNVNLLGIILNATQPLNQSTIDDLTPEDTIEALTQIPILGYLPYIENINSKTELITAGGSLFRGLDGWMSRSVGG